MTEVTPVAGHFLQLLDEDEDWVEAGARPSNTKKWVRTYHLLQGMLIDTTRNCSNIRFSFSAQLTQSCQFSTR